MIFRDKRLGDCGDWGEVHRGIKLLVIVLKSTAILSDHNFAKCAIKSLLMNTGVLQIGMSLL